MSRRFVPLSLTLILAAPTAGQTIPPGGNAYFGSPEKDKFNQTTVFDKWPKQLPPREGGYYGTAAGEQFSATGVFGPMPSPAPANPMDPPPPPPPGYVPPDGGLFPSPPPPPPKKIWSGSFEAGGSGATGNSEVLGVRLAAFAGRKTEVNILHFDFLYNYGSQDGRTTQNAALFNARDELLFPGHSYTLFGATNIEFDELRAYRFRVGVYGGVGYIVLNNDSTLFKLRVGAGAVRELGGERARNRWVPEGVLGYDFKYKLTDRQSFLSNLDVYPRLDTFKQFRARGRIAYEIVLDPKTGTALRLGAQSRYDSDPGANFNRHDLNYFTSLVVNF
jgi:putative salt-induced outer membrane protein YdiY